MKIFHLFVQPPKPLPPYHPTPVIYHQEKVNDDEMYANNDLDDVEGRFDENYEAEHFHVEHFHEENDDIDDRASDLSNLDEEQDTDQEDEIDESGSETLNDTSDEKYEDKENNSNIESVGEVDNSVESLADLVSEAFQEDHANEDSLLDFGDDEKGTEEDQATSHEEEDIADNKDVQVDGPVSDGEYDDGEEEYWDQDDYEDNYYSDY